MCLGLSVIIDVTVTDTIIFRVINAISTENWRKIYPWICKNRFSRRFIKLYILLRIYYRIEVEYHVRQVIYIECLKILARKWGKIYSGNFMNFHIVLLNLYQSIAFVDLFISDLRLILWFIWYLDRAFILTDVPPTIRYQNFVDFLSFKYHGMRNDCKFLIDSVDLCERCFEKFFEIF